MGRSLDLRSDQIDDSERSKLRRRPLSAHCCWFSVNRKYFVISCICAQKQYVDFRSFWRSASELRPLRIVDLIWSEIEWPSHLSSPLQIVIFEYKYLWSWTYPVSSSDIAKIRIPGVTPERGFYYQFRRLDLPLIIVYYKFLALTLQLIVFLINPTPSSQWAISGRPNHLS